MINERQKYKTLPPAMWQPEEDISDPPAGYGFTPDSTPEKDIYFFHSDHLGSTSYLTDSAGSVCQFVCYTPYGEAFVDEHTTSYENPFKFSGKELDDITGLYDHGARSRNPVTTLWLGVDPVFHPASSPYAYCLGNPVKLVDPNGMEEEQNNSSLWDKLKKTINKIDKGGTSDPSNSGSDESIKSLKDKVVKFFKEGEKAPAGGEHGYGDGRTGENAVGPKSNKSCKTQDNSNFGDKVGNSGETGTGTPDMVNEESQTTPKLKTERSVDYFAKTSVTTSVGNSNVDRTVVLEFDTLWVDRTKEISTGKILKSDTILDTRRGIDKRKK